jgi:hypothetical protein
MASSFLRWSVRLALAAIAATVVARLAARRTGEGPVLPAVTGDTWPPVPTNPAREA